MHKIATWAKNNKIIFNKEKSKVLVISRERPKHKIKVNIFLNNKELEQVDRLKYIGIILDSTFNFSAHIEYIGQKCVRLVHALSKSAKLTWGLSQEVLKTIYNGAVLPLLSYRAPVWIEALTRKYNCIKLIRVQRLINIKLAKAYRTTSSDILCIITRLTPIIIKLEEICKAYKLRREC